MRIDAFLITKPFDGEHDWIVAPPWLTRTEQGRILHADAMRVTRSADGQTHVVAVGAEGRQLWLVLSTRYSVKADGSPFFDNGRKHHHTLGAVLADPPDASAAQAALAAAERAVAPALQQILASFEPPTNEPAGPPPGPPAPQGDTAPAAWTPEPQRRRLSGIRLLPFGLLIVPLLASLAWGGWVSVDNNRLRRELNRLRQHVEALEGGLPAQPSTARRALDNTPPDEVRP